MADPDLPPLDRLTLIQHLSIPHVLVLLAKLVGHDLLLLLQLVVDLQAWRWDLNIRLRLGHHRLAIVVALVQVVSGPHSLLSDSG